MMDDSEIERIYSQQLHEELLNQTRLAVTQFIELCPDVFGLENLILQTDQFLSPINERVAQLYQDVCETYIDNGLPFDHAWVNHIKRYKVNKNSLTRHRIGLCCGDSNSPSKR